MSKNDLERLLQRVLTEANYKKVKDLLEREPSIPQNHDFVITNANTHYQQQANKKSNPRVPPGKLRTASLNKAGNKQNALNGSRTELQP